MIQRLPKIPVLRTMHCEDHRTFVVPYQYKDLFISRWKKKGLSPAPAIMTKDFPAEHIALSEKPGETRTCERMVGVSVSRDPSSPINELCKLAGPEANRGVLQHVAYSVQPETSFADIRRQLEEQDVVFMTPVLEYSDSNGATLRQMFVGCVVPFGQFIEIIQRTPDKNGTPFQGFHSLHIDALYGFYNQFSLELRARS